MQRLNLWLTLFSLILASCSPAKVVTPNPTATAISIPTPAPTAMPTITPIPSIQVGNLTLPDPHYSNPELFDLNQIDAPIPQFVNAMRMGGNEITAEQVAQGITFQALKDKDGKLFVAGIYALNDSTTLAGEYPLLIADEDEKAGWVWMPTTLKKLGEKGGIQVGVLLFQNASTVPIEVREFNLGIIPFGWNDFVTKYGIGFGWADNLLREAQMANMDIRFMHVIAPGQTPDWVNTFSRMQFIDFTNNVISQVMSHFKGKVSQYVIVNEPYIYPYRQQDPFYKIIGPDYIPMMFEEARKANPSAILIYNDTDNHTSNGMTTVLTRRIVDDLKSRGLIDGVGVQMHIGQTSKIPTVGDKADIIKTLQAYGVPVYVTEMDVDMTSVAGTPEVKASKQAEIYKLLIDAAIGSGVCKSITFWGVGDKYSWLKVILNHQNADGLLFDDSLHPKPAYYGVSSVLFSYIRNSSSNSP